MILFIALHYKLTTERTYFLPVIRWLNFLRFIFPLSGFCSHARTNFLTLVDVITQDKTSNRALKIDDALLAKLFNPVLIYVCASSLISICKLFCPFFCPAAKCVYFFR